MKANYTEICRIGNLEADFQKVTFVQFFWNFQNIVVKYQLFKFEEEEKEEEKQNRQKFPKITLL